MKKQISLTTRNLESIEPRLWTEDDVGLWLEMIGMKDYQNTFAENCIGGEELADLTKEELQEIGVKQVGHYKKILRKVKLLFSGNDRAYIDDDSGSSSSNSGSRISSMGSIDKSNRTITVKVCYKKEWVAFKIEPSSYSWSKLRKRIKREFGIPMTFKYKNEEGNLIKISRIAHYRAAISQALPMAVLRLYVKPKAEKKKSEGRFLKVKEAANISTTEKSILASMLDAAVVIDPDGIVLLFNDAAEKMFGRRRSAIVGKNVNLLMPRSTAESHDFYLYRYGKNPDRKLASTVIGKGREVIAQHAKGHAFPVHLSVSVSTGTYVGIFTKLHEEQTGTTAEMLQQRFALLEQLLHCVIVIDTKGIIQFTNKEAEKLLGYTKEEVLGENVKMFCGPDDYDQHDEYLARFLKTNEPHVMGTSRAIKAKTKDDKLIDVRLSLTEQDDDLGHFFTGILDPLKVVQHSAEEDLKGLRIVLQDLLVPAIVIDTKGKIQIFNRAAEKMLGFKEEEVTGRNVRALMPSPDREKHNHYIARYLKHRKGRVIGIGREVVAQHKGGKLIPVHLSVAEKTSTSGTILFTGTLQAT
eukprot:TRINITY_DN1233_c0_g1_i1.p1 TRINITY_DN1233_c0_g1~~TRINITY_DN1233_c0_g1_i1.p1  ORF type:complete len:581 (-),score=106.30 TRINITY_DN1233_c0_g1_i1:274-2016(-)